MAARRRDQAEMRLRFIGACLAMCLLAACSSDDTSIVISEIRDQDGRALTVPVRVFVDGTGTACAPGLPCTISVESVPDDGRTVTIEADAGPDYSQITPRVHQVMRGQQYPLQLTMFRGYSIRIEVEDAANSPIEGVEIWSNGRLLGITDEFGLYQWSINDKTVRNGHRIDIEVASTAFPRQSLEPIRIESGQYTYERLFSTATQAGRDDRRSDPPPTPATPATPAPPSLALRSSPVGVEILVRSPSGQSFRMVSNDSRRVDKGTYSYAVKNVPAGYQVTPTDGSITVGPSGRSTIRLKMKQVSGNTLTINIEPAGAELVLTGDQSGQSYRVKQNGSITVVPDFYSWEVTSAPPGYARQSSRNMLDLVSLSDEVLNVTLSLDASVNPFVEGSKLFDANRFDDAARMYLNVPEPKEGESFQNYAESQYRLGLINLVHSKTKNLRAAARYFENVLRYDSRDYNSHFYLGLAHLEGGGLRNAREHFRWIQMNLLLIPTESRETRNLEALYYLSLCDYQQFEATVDPEQRQRRADDARRALTNFVRQSEGVTSVDRLYKDATSKIEFLSDQVN